MIVDDDDDATDDEGGIQFQKCEGGSRFPDLLRRTRCRPGI